MQAVTEMTAILPQQIDPILVFVQGPLAPQKKPPCIAVKGPGLNVVVADTTEPVVEPIVFSASDG